MHMDTVFPVLPLNTHNKTSGNLAVDAGSCDTSLQRSTGPCNRTLVKCFPAFHSLHPYVCAVCVFLSTYMQDHTSREVFQHRHDYSSNVLSSGTTYLCLRQHNVCGQDDNNASPRRDFWEVLLTDDKIKTNCNVGVCVIVCVWGGCQPHLSFVVIIMSVQDCTHAHT